MEIMHSYYPGISDYYHSEIKGLIETVCNHTMSIQLIAKLLSLSVYTPDVLLNQLKENVLLSTHNSFVGNPSAHTVEDLYGNCYQCKQEEIFICCLICNYRLSLPSHTIVAAIVIETVLYHRWLTVAFAYSVAENVISSIAVHK